MASLSPPHLPSIGVIAPSSACRAEDLAAGLSRLTARFEVRLFQPLSELVDGTADGTAASDNFQLEGLVQSRERQERPPAEERLGGLIRALHDPAVDCLLAVRGGYGALDLIDQVPSELVREARKPLIGYSDITALHALWAKHGVPTLHAPMLSELGGLSKDELDAWSGAVCSIGGSAFNGLSCLSGGGAEGRVIGGNLALLAAVAATPYAPPLQGSILFIEDVNEPPYRVDRLLTTLRLAGWWSLVGGVVLGRFHNCSGPRGPERPNTPSVDEVLVTHFKNATFPVAAGLPVGHGKPNLPLWLGIHAAFDADRGHLCIQEQSASG